MFLEPFQPIEIFRHSETETKTSNAKWTKILRNENSKWVCESWWEKGTTQVEGK